ncbi:MAG: type II secretion system protein [Planctomycetota bacterium]
MTRAQRQSERTGARTALTLIELLVVLVILIGIAALMVPIFSDLGIRAFKGGRKLTPSELVTLSTMNAVEEAIMGSASMPGYFKDMKDYPRPDANLGGQPYNCGSAGFAQRPDHPQLRYLFINPRTETDSSVAAGDNLGWDPVLKRGWRGPYLAAGSAGRYQVDSSRGFSTVYGDEIDIFCNDDGDPAPLDGWGNPIIIQELVVQEGPVTRDYTRLVSAGPNGVIDVDPLDPEALDFVDDVVLFLRIPDPVADRYAEELG